MRTCVSLRACRRLVVNIEQGLKRRRCSVIAALPVAIFLDGMQLGIPQQQVIGGQPRGSHDGYGFIEEVWVGDRPLERLHSSHGDAYEGVEMLQFQHLGEHAVLRGDHIADGEFRKANARHGDDEKARGVRQLAGSQQGSQLPGGAGKPGREEDCVRPIGGDLSVGPAGDAAVAKANCSGWAGAAQAKDKARDRRTIRIGSSLALGRFRHVARVRSGISTSVGARRAIALVTRAVLLPSR